MDQTVHPSSEVNDLPTPQPITPVRGKRGRPKVESDESRRTKIIVHAEALFMRQGFIGTTMDDIAAACRMSKQTLYRLFPSKLELIAASVRRHRYSMISLPSEDVDLPLDEALAQIFKIDITPAKDEERLAFLHFIWREAGQIPELASLVFDHGAIPSQQDLAQWLQKQMDRGLIALPNAMQGARILMDMIFGTILQKVLGHHPWPGTDDRQGYIRLCVQIFLKGVST